MTYTYAAKRLLEHGPLTFTEFREITGWMRRTCEVALRNLIETELAVTEKLEDGRLLYRLAD
jgi:predicted transcriptional regulator